MQRHRAVATQAIHACAGVLCPVHMKCARYAWVDGSLEPSTYWLVACATPDATYYPGFIDRTFVGPPEPRHTTITRRGVQGFSPVRRRPFFAPGLA